MWWGPERVVVELDGAVVALDGVVVELDGAVAELDGAVRRTPPQWPRAVN